MKICDVIFCACANTNLLTWLKNMTIFSCTYIIVKLLANQILQLSLPWLHDFAEAITSDKVFNSFLSMCSLVSFLADSVLNCNYVKTISNCIMLEVVSFSFLKKI